MRDTYSTLMFTKQTKPAICKPLYSVLARLLVVSYETRRSAWNAVKEEEHTLVELLLLLLFPFVVLLVKQQTMVHISHTSMVFQKSLNENEANKRSLDECIAVQRGRMISQSTRGRQICKSLCKDATFLT